MIQRYFLLRISIQLILFICSIGRIFSENNSRLLIISLDGFSHRYLKIHSLPTIERIQNEGIKTKYGMQPTFVTMTFPNHISIATGMYQEDHGIIHNRFFDTNLNKSITFGTRDEGQWSDPKVEPLWITATRQNKSSAVIYWPASHNEFHGIRPQIYTPLYSDSVPLREKIDSAISYFHQSSVQLVMLYHFEPDRQGHVYGPDSNEVHQTLLRIDSDMNYLLTKVKNQLNDDLNIIILSDHGMTNTKRVIQPFFEGYINKAMVEENILDGPLFSVTPRAEQVGYLVKPILDGEFEQVLDGLRRIPDVTVYKRDEFPTHYHYAKAVSRIGEIIVLPDHEDTAFSQITIDASFSKGNHGYNNTLPSMQAIFMAKGPDFNQHTEIDSLKNVDVYHIACRILSLEPNPYASAGSLDDLTNIFRTGTNKCTQSVVDVSVVLILLFLNFIIRI